MNQSLTLRNKMFLLGETNDTISGHKLPTNKQVLKLLYYHTRQESKTLTASYSVVVEGVCKFWSRAGIPVQKKDRCIKKLENLHITYRNLQKYKNQASLSFPNILKNYLI